ncbi:MAG: cytochrome C oxidase subunit IV family protein [Haloarculaceae archaeon]
MTSNKLYTAIFVVLFVSATVQVLVERFVGPGAYWLALAIILGLSFFKAAIVAGWYQHLRFDPRPLTYLVLVALVIVVTFTVGATFSVVAGT